MSKVVGLIPSRLASTRLPGKALADIHGMPVIAHVAIRSKMASCLDRVIVCTDSQKIADVCKYYDIESVLTDSSFLNGTERIASVAESIDADYIVDIQGDEPLINPDHIDAVSEAIKSSLTVDIVIPTLKVSSSSPRTIVRVQSSLSGRIMTLTRASLPCPYASPSYFIDKHLSIIGFTKQALRVYSTLSPSPNEEVESIELLRALENDMRLQALPLDGDSFSVDVQDDLVRARVAMESDPLFAAGYNL
ncbi:3-deoxy-manno-octulosonate cytidylyltransferase [Synechococcus sp. LTW-R]|uniref:3-deoxy-manno-octulosonate cytidylyltransferase n=1 Tax=Synechococcus sp. LTW-R TaxID=2751170 RepID=UPI001625FB9C|nr:3-deoxy-manno-octulosonate cytidylyltransferase [Synechococcus sp. LTW-R]QNG28922.1 3-deoxy-manno-octulosonate cytidylyltransferase [Synechococcus sp. LTW-R]